MALSVSRTILSMMTLGTDGGGGAAGVPADPDGEWSPVDDEVESALDSRRRTPLLCGHHMRSMVKERSSVILERKAMLQFLHLICGPRTP